MLSKYLVINGINSLNILFVYKRTESVIPPKSEGPGSGSGRRQGAVSVL